MTIYNDVPHGGKHAFSSSAVPGDDITDKPNPLDSMPVANGQSETAKTTGTDVPEDQQHLFESGVGENPTKPEMNYPTSLNGGLHPDSYVEHDWSRQDRLDMLAKLDALNHKLDHVLEHFHANTTWTANLGGDNQITFRKDSAC